MTEHQLSSAMNLVEEQALERRERILETVRQCIAEQGVMKLTIRDLAKACRVSVPTLYRGFGGKEQLLVEAVSTFFNSEVLGEKLESTALEGAPRLLAIVDLCSKTMEEMPEYNRQLFTLFMNSDYGAQLGWDITESINDSALQALNEIKKEGELHSWVECTALAERIGAQCVISVMEFCNDDIPIENFGPTFGYSTAMLAMAATTGNAHALFKKRMKKTQKLARRQPNKRLARTPGKVGA